jgi:3-dehydroquinate synthase
MARTVTVPLGARSYSVLVDEGLVETLGTRCRKLGFARRCAVIADANVAARFGHLATGSLREGGFDPVLIPIAPGEKTKRISVAERCHESLARHRLERRSFVVALGGGVTGDLAGFVAATYLRGIALVQVPTTLLAQVDSSVGGKVGVNLRSGKNLVGAFLQPRLVLCDLETLVTLPDREYRSGLAEVIKYGIIRDAALFRRLEREWTAILRRDPGILGPMIARCCSIKADVVSQDETEGGLRKILNFGHTIGHALEAITAYGRYLHGEAISIGQVAAARISAEQCGLGEREVERLVELFRRYGLPVGVRLTRRQRRRLMAAMLLDKKVSAGEVKFVLARRIGEVVWDQEVPEATLERVLDGLGTTT